MSESARTTTPEGEDKNVVTPPLTDEVTQKKIRDTFKKIISLEEKRTDANEQVTALRQGLVTRGFSLQAQKAVKAYLNLNEAQRKWFDAQVRIMRQAVGEPIQPELDL